MFEGAKIRLFNDMALEFIGKFFYCVRLQIPAEKSHPKRRSKTALHGQNRANYND
jgi:hypothetical protein